MSAREYAGGQRSHDIGPLTYRQQPDLTPEERARAEQEREQQRASDLQALEQFEQSPAHQLTKEQRFRLRMSEPDRLRAADAKADEAKQAGDAEVQGERVKRQHANVQGATQLVSGLRAAKAQAVPGLVGKVQDARIAGKLSTDASPTILQALAQAIASALLEGVTNDEIAAAIRACCNGIGRGETIETIERDMTRLADRLERVLGEKAPRATEPIFAEVPTGEQVAEKIRGAGERALRVVLGDSHGVGADLKQQAADAYNARHPAQVARFNALTHGMCVGGTHGVDAAKVIAWQTAHGVDADGKVGPQTLQAAMAKRKGDETEAGAHANEVEQPSSADERKGAGPAGTTATAAAAPTAASIPRDTPPASSQEVPQPKLKEQDGNQGATSANPHAVVSQATPEKTPTKNEGGGDDSIRAALESIEVVARSEKVLAINPARIFELVPWNTQDKAKAFRPVQAAIKKLREAEGAAKGASNPKAKEKALHQFEQATQQLEGAAANLKAYVLSQLPRIERNDEAMQQYRGEERAARAKLQHAHGGEKTAAEKQLTEAQGHEKAREQELTAEIEGADYGRAESERRVYRVIVDGEVIDLQDHIEAYATTFEAGLDGKARGEKRDKKDGGTTVDQVLETSGFSESIKKILKTISASEGGFSTVNTYDKAVLTWGMLQWTGGEKSDLVATLRIIKRVSPEAFAARFSKYGIDVESEQLVVKGGDGDAQKGADAATAVQESPALTGVMARAGMDPAVQLGELQAAIETKIDGPLNTELTVEHGGKRAHIRVGDVITSEFAVGVLADASVHGGFPKKEIKEALNDFVAKGHDPASVNAWAAQAGKPCHVPIHPDLARILRLWRDECPSTKEGLVFPVEAEPGRFRMGVPEDMLGLSDALTAADAHLPADGKPWHMLRHTFAAHAVMSGASLYAVQKLLGHATPTMTQRYAHLAPSFMAAEVARIAFPRPQDAPVDDLADVRRKRVGQAVAADTMGHR